MEPLRIRVDLIRPIAVGTYPILLDAVLAALQVDAASAQGHPDPWSVQHDLPLERYETDSDWVFKASFFRPSFEFPVQPVAFEIQTSRMSLDRVSQDMNDNLVKTGMAVANPAGGPFKTHFFSIPIQWVLRFEAYAIGKRHPIELLLSQLRYLGGRRSTGHGMVRQVSVEPVALESCRWWDRPLPSDQTVASSSVRAYGRLHAPYWKGQRQEIRQPMI